jgi:hypothetical protein
MHLLEIKSKILSTQAQLIAIHSTRRHYSLIVIRIYMWVDDKTQEQISTIYTFLLTLQLILYHMVSNKILLEGKLQA